MQSKRLKRWLFLLSLFVLLLLVGAYIGREEIERTVVAYETQQAHIFTPPPLTPGESRLHRRWSDARFYWDVAGLRTGRNQRVEKLGPELKSLLKDVDRHQTLARTWITPCTSTAKSVGG